MTGLVLYCHEAVLEVRRAKDNRTSLIRNIHPRSSEGARLGGLNEAEDDRSEGLDTNRGRRSRPFSNSERSPLEQVSERVGRPNGKFVRAGALALAADRLGVAPPATVSP